MKVMSLLLALFAWPALGKNIRHQDYPSDWWREIPRSEAASWEVLPQDAKPGEVILSKRTELGILSNFAATPIEIDGEKFPGVEGFWQMMKYPEGTHDERLRFPGLQWKFTRDQVGQMVGFEAKNAGNLAEQNMKAMNINWITFKGKKMLYRIPEKGDHYQLIRRAMVSKLEKNPDVKRILLATGNLILKPDHHQGDDIPPAWKYYEIWMELRSELMNRAK